MNIWICTDMEGLSGIDHSEQCYASVDDTPEYRYGCEQLTAEANAAIAGCFDAGADEVCILDGHGRNRNGGFTDQLNPRARRVWLAGLNPNHWEGLDKSVDAVAMIGQHAMAGTINGFLNYTQVPKEIRRFLVNGEECGEMSQMALYAGCYGVPLVYASGDEALCEEAHRLFPHIVTTPTKRGTGWETCELYPVEEVRASIRRDIAQALRQMDKSHATRLPLPIEITVEWAYSAHAVRLAYYPGVRRLNARTVAWTLYDPRDIFTWPNPNWHVHSA
jgi:D-amino peptidase